MSLKFFHKNLANRNKLIFSSAFKKADFFPPAKGIFGFRTRKRMRLAVAFFLVGFFIFNVSFQVQSFPKSVNQPSFAGQNSRIMISQALAKDQPVAEKYVYQPGPISIEKMKKQGCVADGILSGYGEDTAQSVAMINRSNCQYLHRALETWAAPPDFEKARSIMQQINKPGVIYGMFLAEAIKKNADYSYPEKGRDFKFSKMCKKGSENMWGEHTCKANLDSPEYRRYLSYITRQAMDLGIQSFLFGQIYFQESGSLADSKMPEILAEMRAYAQSKGMQIAIGAQTGNITDEKYLRQFDFIEGGVGIGDDGIIESGPCWSRLQGCWALLWHKNYSTKANNVFLHLDWSGLKFDDMSVFARMDQSRRIQTLQTLYAYFTSQNMGFLLPMMATVNEENGGCYGPKKNLYSAANDYSCKDENAVNSLLKLRQ